jgi:WD40 repeat protein
MRLLSLIALGLPLLIAPLIVSAMGVSAARNEAYLVFAAVLNNDGDYGEFEFDPPTGVRHQILFIPGEGTIYPSYVEEEGWSPSREWYALFTGSALIIQDRLGPAQCQLDDVDQSFRAITWSPDSRWLAYISIEAANQTLALQVVAPLDCETRVLTPLQRSYPYFMDWSPDGQMISFAADGEIFVVNADGTNLRQLPLDTSSNGWGVWSPDSARLAYTRNAGTEISITNISGTDIQAVADNLQTVYRLFWR